MSTIAAIAYGIALSHSATLGGTYVALAEILELTAPGPQSEAVKVYRSDNAANVVEKIPGWIEETDAEATITYAPAQRTIIEGIMNVPLFWKVTYPKVAGQVTTGDVDGFPGFISMIGKETPIKDMMKCKIKISVSGAVTFTVGS